MEKKKTSENNEEIKSSPESAEASEIKESVNQEKGETKSSEKANGKLEKENETLKKELNEQKDKYLRLLAEYENHRKRTQKEKNDLYSDAFTAAVTSFLPLLDNMERAWEFVKDDESIKVIIKQLGDILSSLDVKVIDTDGKKFDPNFHYAIMHEDEDSDDESIIRQTFQKGYMLGDKVIRHAMVKVIN